MMKTKLFVSFSLFLILTLLFPVSALAQGITVDGTVEEGEVVENNLILYGPTVVMDGVINGDVVAVGENVTINGEINGSLIVAGKQVVINGPVTGSVYSAALTLDLGPEAVIERDVYFAGGVLTMASGSTINRDLNVFALEAGLNGSIGRNVNALVGPLSMVQALYHLITGQDLNLLGMIPASQAMQGGSAQISLPAPKNLLLITPIAVRYPSWVSGLGAGVMPQAGSINSEDVEAWALPFLRNLIGLLILGLLSIWLAPASLALAGEQLRHSPWRALLNGLLAFFFGWIIALLAIVLAIALTSFLLWLTLPYLGLLVGMFSLLAIGVSVTVFLFSIAFFSKLVVVYLLSSMLFNRFMPTYAKSKFLVILLGILIYALLASVPYLGWFISVITTLLGLGAMWMAINNTRWAMDSKSNTAQGAIGEMPAANPIAQE